MGQENGRFSYSTLAQDLALFGVRKARRIAAILASIPIIAAFVCLDLVDYRPYFREPYYKTTIAALQRLPSTNQIVRGQLQAGFGRARLTPEIGGTAEDPANGRFRAIPMAGYGDRKGHPAEGVHDDLFVKAVALRVGHLTGIIFSSDALIVPREVADAAATQLHQEFGLGREQLYFSATHTHCGLGGWGEEFVGEAFAGKFHPGARTWMATRFVSAAREALGDLKPAEMSGSSFDEPRFIRNRLVGDLGRVNSEFNFLAIRQQNGRPGIIGSYGAHATVLSGRVMEFSADYPGYWQRAIEEATGGEALFVAGSVGSHAPVAGQGGFEGAEVMGKSLANGVLARLKTLTFTNTVTFSLTGLAVALPEYNVRLTDGLRLRPWVSGRLLKAPSGETFLQAFRFNDAVWISTPCDFSGELALDIKNLFRVRGFNANITSFNGDYIGYVVRSRYYHMGGYEPQVMSFYGPYVPDYLDELIRGLATVVTTDLSAPKDIPQAVSQPLVREQVLERAR